MNRKKCRKCSYNINELCIVFNKTIKELISDDIEGQIQKGRQEVRRNRKGRARHNSRRPSRQLESDSKCEA